MFRAALVAALLVLPLTSLADECEPEERGFPVVYEHYDAVAICIPTSDHDPVGYNPPKRVLFIRNGKIIANRWFEMNDMLIQPTPEGKFSIEWRDYWRCDRLVTFDELIAIQHDWKEPGEGQEWWMAGRNMTDLKEPE